ncbi:MAG: hypothetical protein Q9181_008008, partial [Wetmoreana brouardii]
PCNNGQSPFPWSSGWKYTFPSLKILNLLLAPRKAIDEEVGASILHVLSEAVV